MIPATFDYAAPETLEEAVRLIAARPDDAKILTGGHSLIPMMKMRLATPGLVVDLRKVKRLTELKRLGQVLEIGGAVTHAELERSEEVRRAVPLLAETATEIGDMQVRNAGTIGGSVVHADPAADWPAALIATDATMVLVGPKGERSVAAEDFFVGLLESAAAADEVLAAVQVPIPGAGSGGSYQKVAQSASGFAIAGAAVQLTLNGDAVGRARVGITGVGDRAYRPKSVEAALSGCPLDPDSVRSACAGAAEGIEPLEDIHAGPRYRAHLATVLTVRAVLRAAERARG